MINEPNDGGTEVIAPNPHPRILTEKEFEDLLKKLRQNAPDLRNARRTGSNYLFGKVDKKCRQCGASMNYRLRRKERSEGPGPC